MYYYLVSGTVLTPELTGHIVIDERIGSKFFIADSTHRNRMMADMGIWQALDYDINVSLCDWIDGPHVIAMPEDQLMRLHKQPELPGLALEKKQ